LITLHDPSGRLITFDSRQISAVQPTEELSRHVAPGTKSIIYVAGKAFGVTEDREQIKAMIEECQE
jgi:hypothetical protein